MNSPDLPANISHPDTDRNADDPEAAAVNRSPAAAFLAEIASLEALDDDAFADVVPALRPNIVGPISTRGRLDE